MFIMKAQALILKNHSPHIWEVGIDAHWDHRCGPAVVLGVIAEF